MKPCHHTLVEVAAALCTSAPQVLSPFELELVDEVRSRRLAVGDEAFVLTAAEIAVLEEVVQATSACFQAIVAARKATFRSLHDRWDASRIVAVSQKPTLAEVIAAAGTRLALAINRVGALVGSSRHDGAAQ